MRLVVDLNDEVYNNMVVKNKYTDMDVVAVHNALIGAIRIPEGHGRLIDADRVITEAKKSMKYPANHKYMECVIAHMNLAPTIIEADKDGEQG